MPSQAMIDKHGKRLAYYIYHKNKGTLKSQQGGETMKKPRPSGRVKLGEPSLKKNKPSAFERYKRHRNYMKKYD